MMLKEKEELEGTTERVGGRKQHWMTLGKGKNLVQDVLDRSIWRTPFGRGKKD